MQFQQKLYNGENSLLFIRLSHFIWMLNATNNIDAYHLLIKKRRIVATQWRKIFLSCFLHRLVTSHLCGIIFMCSENVIRLKCYKQGNSERLDADHYSYTNNNIIGCKIFVWK